MTEIGKHLPSEGAYGEIIGLATSDFPAPIDHLCLFLLGVGKHLGVVARDHGQVRLGARRPGNRWICPLLAYTVGQSIISQLGYRLGARLVITAGITITAIMNLLFGFGQAYGVMILIWGINGDMQSMGWAPTVMTLAN